MKTRSQRGFSQEKQTNNQQRQMCWLPASPGRCSGSPTSQTPAASGCAACARELMGKLPSSPTSKEVAACDARDGTSCDEPWETLCNWHWHQHQPDDLVPWRLNPVGAARCLSPRCPDISAKACRAAPIPQVRAFQVLFLIWQCQREKLGSGCSSPVSPL